jgi:1-acyl-sn-glycerol-3-phosphate acyltransferase
MKDKFTISPRLLNLIEGPIGEFIYRYFNRVEVYGQENLPKTGAILAPNHPSIMDPPLLFLSTYKSIGRMIQFVAWAGLLEKEPFASVLKESNVIPVNPPGATGSDEIKKAYPISKTNKMVNESLKNGELVCVFPEGNNHLVWDGNTLYPLQKGVFLWAALSGSPLIPVGIRNTQYIWPMLANIDIQKINFQMWLMAPIVLPVPIEIHFGKPIYVDRDTLKSNEKLLKLEEKFESDIKTLGNLK